MNYTKCVTKDGKNYAAIEKIIARRSYKDFLAMNPIGKDGRFKHKHRRPYSLSEETLEAVEIKKQYLRGEISEEEYKTYCLRDNLLNREIISK